MFGLRSFFLISSTSTFNYFVDLRAYVDDLGTEEGDPGLLSSSKNSSSSLIDSSLDKEPYRIPMKPPLSAMIDSFSLLMSTAENLVALLLSTKLLALLLFDFVEPLYRDFFE